MDDLIPGGKGKADDNLDIEVEDAKPPPGKGPSAPVEDQDRQARSRDLDDDARLAYDTGDDDEIEERGLSRRQRRNRQRKTAVVGRDQVIDNLNARVEALTGMINQMGQSQVGLTIHNIDTQIGSAQQALQLAEAEMRKATAENNLARYEELRGYREEAQQQLHRLNGTKYRVQQNAQQAGRPQVAPNGGPPVQRPPTNVSLNKRAQDFTETFLSRFPDFDPNGADETSLIMKAIDDSVAAEGYRPDTPLYWRTLEQKLSARGIYPDTDDDDDDDPPPRREAPPRRVNGGGRPPTTGGTGNRRGTGATFRLQPMMRDYLESEGILELNGLTDEQKAKRSRLINDWRERERKVARGEAL